MSAKNWPIVDLQHVAEVISGQSPPGSTYRDSPEGLPFFQGKADFGPTHPTPTKWCVAPKKIAQPGDVLVSVRAPVGPTNVANQKCCIGRGLAAIRAGEKVDQDFLRWVFKHLEAKLERKGSGSTFQSINRRDLLRLRFRLPPLSEQRAIAKRLSEQMEQVDAARQAAQARLAAAKALYAAHLSEVFDPDIMTRWPLTKLGECGEVKSGITLGRKTKNGISRTLPYLRVANVKDGYLDLNQIKTIDVTEREAEKFQLAWGDLLLTEGGDEDKLGRGTVWRSEIPQCLHQNHIFRVRFQSQELVTDFVAAQLASAYGKSYFVRHAKRTTGIASINQRVLKGFPLRLPPRSQQETILSKLQRSFEIAKAMRTAIDQQLRSVDALPSVCLWEVFGDSAE